MSDPWRDLRFLIGAWETDGQTQLGNGKGHFSFSLELDAHVVVRRSRTQYADTPQRPAFSHQELTIIAADGDGLQATYFDSEGHVIRYRVDATADGCVWTSEPVAGARFRMSYRPVNGNEVDARFEIAPPGGEFATYVESRARRAGTDGRER
ncbi:MAG: hypothetical protein AUH85_16330 [Chloroflexi bacterium 13_1_40CM_4_68_4]|nr:MAG: hypothetical protein AUH85_16330 [Chloroflexi bacterium 13_1_40CM_4_68_4]